jgi:NitT/TauT family transport system substrate-binding protein
MTSISRRGFAALAAGAALARPALAQSLTKVTVGQVTTTTLSFTAVVLAQQAGYFREEGLDVEILEFRGSGVLLPQLTSKRVTIGYPNPDILIVSHQPGKDPLPLRFFYNATRESGWEFVVPEASPVKTLADLKGKKIGIGAATFGNVPITRAMFREIGLQVGRDVDLVPVGVGAPAFLALRNGSVDALNLFDSQHATLEVSGTPIRRLDMPQKYLGLFSNGFVAHNDTIRDQADLLTRYGRAVAKATIACEVNPEAAVRAFWKAYPNQKPTEGEAAKIMRDQVHIMNARLRKFYVFPQGQPRRYGSFIESEWKDFIDVLHAGGELTTTQIEPGRLYTNDLVEGINRFDVAAAEAAARRLP